MKKEVKELIREEYEKVWDSKGMIDFCTNKTASVAFLPNGDIVTVDKEIINTSFCFGESGYDYDDALKAAQHARKSEDYFKRENMRSFTQWIDELTEALDINCNYRLVIRRPEYNSQPDDCRLAGIRFIKLTEILEACGGSAHLEELPGKEITVWGNTYRIATGEEIEVILDAYREASQQHEKKVDAYLKRYGLSKVHSWTYWRDA